MNYRRTLGTIRFGLFVCCVLSASAYHAAAKVYPPTQAGLQQLVADDSPMLPTPYAIKLRKKLSDWEHGVGVKCYNFPNVRPFCFPAAKDVIADIQAHIFKVDGFVIDSTEWKASMPSNGTSTADGGLPDTPINLDQVFPQIVSPNTPTTLAFNKAVTDFGLKVWTEEGGPPRAYPEQDDDEDVEVDYAQNPDPLPGVISIFFSWGDYPHGAAHGEFGGYDFNWNVAQKRPVEVGDIFDTKTDWKHGLATAILAAFQNADPSYFENSTAADIIGEVSDPGRWAITKPGLRIDTDVYEVGPYSASAPEVVESWSLLKSYLRRGGLVDP